MKSKIQNEISTERLEEIFFMMHEIHYLQKYFVEKLEHAKANMKNEVPLGPVFLKLMHTKIYSKYFENHPKSIEALSKCLNQNRRLERCISKVTNNISLENLLKKPVQRVQNVNLEMLNSDHHTYDHLVECLK